MRATGRAMIALRSDAGIVSRPSVVRATWPERNESRDPGAKSADSGSRALQLRLAWGRPSPFQFVARMSSSLHPGQPHPSSSATSSSPRDGAP
jgi:hypothetical protein